MAPKRVKKHPKRSLKMTGRRGLSLFLSLVMMISLVQIGAFAANGDSAATKQATQQIEGGTTPEYYTYDAASGTFSKEKQDTNPVVTSAGKKVEISKEISATGEENLFDITLNVKTKQEITQSTASPDAAVTLILDVSGSMASCAVCGQHLYSGLFNSYYYHQDCPGHKNGAKVAAEDTRLAAAKATAAEFLQKFAASANGDARRMVSVVTFSTGATALNFGNGTCWLDVADPDNLKTVIDAINHANANGGTNMDAGLRVAHALLKQDATSSIDYRYAILLSDGEPTYAAKGDFNAQSNNQLFYDSADHGMGNAACTVTVEKVETVARAIRSLSAATEDKTPVQLYSVYYGQANDTMRVYNEGKKGHSDRYSSKNITSWLTSISTSEAFTAENADDLNTSFDNIISIIEMQTNAWTVTDKMGDRIQFVSGNGIVTGGQSNQAKTYDAATGTITWRLPLDQTKTTIQENGQTWFSYSMTYQVRLNNLGDNFDTNVYYLTNGETKLEYSFYAEQTINGVTQKGPTDESGKFVYNENGQVNPGMEQWTKNQVLYFKVPAVKGYQADLDFTKVGSDTGDKLTGAQFTLADESGAIRSSAKTSDADGKVEFTNIPSGYTYTLTETRAPEGYNKVDPITVTVAYGKVTTNPEIEDGKLVDPAQQSYINVPITKTWQKPADQATPDSITVTLLQDGTEYKTVTLTAEDCTVSGNTWTYVFENLPEFAPDGEPYVYTVKEAAMDGWDVSYDGYSITNTASGKTFVIVDKEWILPEDMDADSASVSVTLTQNGTVMTDSKYTQTIYGNSNVIFNDLKKYDENGQLYVYDVVETGSSYTPVSKDVDTSEGYTHISLTNTVAYELTTVSGTKTWNDNNNADGKRPDSITVSLYNGDTLVASQEVTAENNWTYSFTGLDRYEFTRDGNNNITGVSEIEYTVKETPVDGYASVVNGADITNTRTGTINLAVYKDWVTDSETDHPAEVTVQLYADGVKVCDPVTFSDGHLFQDLPQYNEQGAEIKYSLVEEPVAGFTTEYSEITKVEDGLYTVDITNTQLNFDPEDTLQITVAKTWQQPESIDPQTAAFYVYANGELVETIEITGNDVKSITVPRYEEVYNDTTGGYDFVEISYSVEEDVPDNYTVFVEDPVGPDSNGNIYYHFVNTIQGTTSLSLEKTWVQPADVDTPVATFTIQRSVDGKNWEEVSPITLMDGKTSETRDDLEKYDGNGQLYIYRVVENSVPGYSSVITGGVQEDGSFAFEAVNTINQATANITVSKTWIDGSTPNSQRPDVTLDLLQDGIVVGTVTFGWGTDLFGEERVIATMNGVPFGADVSEDGNTWSIQFADMPLYNDTRTHRYEYTVQELNVPGDYQVSVAGTTATNKLSGAIEIPITKYWADPDGTTDRPDITLRLTGTDGSERVMTISDDSGEPVVTSNGESLPITVDGSTWTFYVKNLPEYTESGAKITYTLTEDPVAGYTSSSVDGQPFAIKNTIDQDSSYSISAAKVWENMDTDGHYDPKYPESITVALYRDGVKVEDSERTMQPDENSDWGTVTYSDLDKYNPTTGKAYVYAIYELDENGNRVENGGTISFGEDNDYAVTYETEGDSTTITNTFKEPAKYLWVVNAHYTHYDYNGNVTASYDTQSEVFSETSSQLVSADPDDYVVCSKDNLTYVYDADNENNKTEVTLEQENYLYELHLYYELRDEAPTDPDEPDNPGGGGGRGDRTVTVYYREEGTRDQLADTEQREYDYGDAWDVTDLTDLAIDGYVITHVEGDTSGDRLTSNKTVTVWYSNDETDIEDPDTPTTDLPDGGDTGDTGDTGNTGGGTDIGDEDVPLAEAPETGDASLLWVILAIASGSGLIWLALTGKKRKECEEQ